VTAAPPDLQSVRAGLRMQRPPDPQQLAREAQWLEELDRGPFLARLRGWLSLSGPGYLQSAMTLGAGTATSSLFAGAMFGYDLLWVAPLGMVLGVVMFAAISHQTLSTGLRPLPAMARYAGRPFAVLWAAGALIASVVWHVPQYTLATGSLDDLGKLSGLAVPPIVLSLTVLAAAVAITFCYGSSPRLVRAYERALKWMVWAIVVSLGWVVMRTDTDWGKVLAGFVPHLPPDRGGTSSITLVVSGLGAAVGINMVFLYPYSLLARGWGRAHRGLARCDLIGGMLLPYVLATSLMVIAAANTLYASGEPVGKGATVQAVGGVLGQVLGPVAGRVMFDLGILAMAFSTISLHMVVCGFVASEWFGCAIGSRAHRLWSLLPAPACLAPLVWPSLPPWLGVPTNIVCLLLLPTTYVGFLVLQCRSRYLGADRPRGWRLVVQVAAMALAIAVIVAALAAYLATL